MYDHSSSSNLALDICGFRTASSTETALCSMPSRGRTSASRICSNFVPQMTSPIATYVRATTGKGSKNFAHPK
eukprot:3953-Pyramimonas_sp.AAC.1